MVKLIPYLSVNNALEALELYTKVFDAETVNHMPVGKEQASEFGIAEGTDLSKTTIHATCKIGDQPFFMSDNFTGEVLEKSNVSVLIIPDTLEQMKKYYESAENNGCTVTMKLEKQFWGDYFCSFKDPFGIYWQMNFTPEEE